VSSLERCSSLAASAGARVWRPVIAQRLADPAFVADPDGTMQKAERSHQLDPGGATGFGSLRLQETFRVDPNDKWEGVRPPSQAPPNAARVAARL
jgi:hypothetical protein